MFEVAEVKDEQVTVRTRDASRWVPLREACVANPDKWLTIPADIATDVRKAGKNSVQSFLDSEKGPGGTVELGSVGEGDAVQTVIRYTPPQAPAKAGKAA